MTGKKTKNKAEPPRKKENNNKKDDIYNQGQIPPGLRVHHMLRLRGPKYNINGISWSPDGQLIASASKDETIRIWDTESGKVLRTLGGHLSEVCAVIWAPNGKMLASASRDNSVRLWDAQKGKLVRTLTGHKRDVFDVAWSPDGKMLASASLDNTFRLWDTETWELMQIFTVHSSSVNSLAWSPDGKMLASASHDQTVRLRDTETWETIAVLKGHKQAINSLAWSPDGDILASASEDHTIRLWDTEAGQETNVLEGHTGSVYGVSFSSDGWLLASRSQDKSVRLFLGDTWQEVANVSLSTDTAFSGLCFHPTLPFLATLGDKDQAILIWEIDLEALLCAVPSTASVRYTAAKIVMVGNPGVGKTSLGWRLAYDKFKEHSPSHGQKFFVVSDFGTKIKDGVECEAVLWDFSGKKDYRIVHSLFLDDSDLSLMLFNPKNPKELLSGENFWQNQLKHKKDCIFSTILISACSDSGKMTQKIEDDLKSYCEKYGISGGFVSIDSRTGCGLEELKERIEDQIHWEDLTATISTTTFKRLKEYILFLRGGENTELVLVSPSFLKKCLNDKYPDWKFSEVKMVAAIRDLESHGFITTFSDIHGNILILLFPELLANLASSFILEAKYNSDGLGRLEEGRLFSGEYEFLELTGLSAEDKKILIDKTILFFLERNICFRETSNEVSFLIFPSLINKKQLIDESVETFDDVSYRINGAVENVYASMVVLLGYTNWFVRTNTWKNQASYGLDGDEICGFRKEVTNRDAEIELVLYYSSDTPKYIQILFHALFESLLLSHKNIEITRHRPVICPTCEKRQKIITVVSQFKQKNEFMYCKNCGEQITFSAIEKLELTSQNKRKKLAKQQVVAKSRTFFEAALVHVKRLISDLSGEEIQPTLFISYAWGTPEHERFVVRLAKDLQNAKINVLLDRWYNPPTYSTKKYTDQIMSCEFVVVLGVPELRQKYEVHSSDQIVASELELINTRLRQHKQFDKKIFPLLLDGESDTAFVPKLQDLGYVDFRVKENYFVNMLEIIWQIHDLPLDYSLLEKLKESLGPLKDK